MANLYAKRAGAWGVPIGAWYKLNGVWTPAKNIYRKNAGSWIRHWPPYIFLNQNVNTYALSPVTINSNSGWSPYGTLIIPSWALTGAIAHITRLDFTLSGYAFDDDHDDDGDMGGVMKLTMGGVFATVSNNQGVVMGGANYTGWYSVPGQNNAGYRTGTINVPANHLLIGMETRIYSNMNASAASAFEFRLITAPVSTGGAIIRTGGVGVSDTVGSVALQGGSRSGSVQAGFGQAVNSVAFGYRFTIGGSGFDDAGEGTKGFQLTLTYQSAEVH